MAWQMMSEKQDGFGRLLCWLGCRSPLNPQDSNEVTKQHGIQRSLGSTVLCLLWQREAQLDQEAFFLGAYPKLGQYGTGGYSRVIAGACSSHCVDGEMTRGG